VLESLRQYGLDEATLASFELGLSLRVAAPKIEAYYQFYGTGVRSLVEGYDEECETWVQWQGKQICSADGLEDIIRKEDHDRRYDLREGIDYSEVKELPFDHVYNPDVQAPTVILYGDIQTDSFIPFHIILKALAKEGLVRYILRYRPLPSQSNNPELVISGYGVELMLKRTDYIVIDDREVEIGSPQSIH
jgi:UDP-glucose:glycoprotein glucosyltransferase